MVVLLLGLVIATVFFSVAKLSTELPATWRALRSKPAPTFLRQRMLRRVLRLSR